MILSYDEENSEIQIVGKAKNDNVSLSHPQISLDDAYILGCLHIIMPSISKRVLLSAIPKPFIFDTIPRSYIF
jgi:hypothetical protein